MISAPISARIMVANGPAMECEKSTTRIPSNAFGACEGRGVCAGNSDSSWSNIFIFPGLIAPRYRPSVILGLLDEGASALVDRPQRFGPAEHADLLQKIPFALRCRRRFGLQNVH